VELGLNLTIAKVLKSHTKLPCLTRNTNDLGDRSVNQTAQAGVALNPLIVLVEHDTNPINAPIAQYIGCGHFFNFYAPQSHAKVSHLISARCF
jgi:hypothetical protein